MLNANEREMFKKRLAETWENMMYYQELKIRLDDSDTVPCTKKEATQAYFEYALAYDTLLDLAKSRLTWRTYHFEARIARRQVIMWNSKQKDIVKNRFEYWVDVMRLDKFELAPELTLKFGSSTKSWGKCERWYAKPTKATITISDVIWVDPEHLDSVILHELCHAVINAIHDSHKGNWLFNAKRASSLYGICVTQKHKVPDDCQKQFAEYINRKYKYDVICANCGNHDKYMRKTQSKILRMG